MRAIFSACLILLMSYCGFAQTPPKFEVASIKPNNSADGRFMIGGIGPSRFTATNVSLQMLLRQAYRIQDYQISGGPAWLRSDRFDIQAKAEGEIKNPPPCFGPDCPIAPLQLMLQGLLADRFQLKIHRETKELPVYELSVAKSGFKLKEVAAPERPAPGAPPPPFPPPGRGGAPPTPPPGAVMMGRGMLMATAAQFATLAQVLSDQLGRPMVDKTGIKGFYDFKLTWTPDVGQGPGGPLGPGGPEPPPVDPSAPSVFTAIQEQFGLKLDSAKGPVEILVIDHVEKPSEN